MFARIFATAFAALASIIFSAPTASAESSPEITAEYSWPHNGCTAVPDNPTLVSFTYACNHHDGCYGRHWASKNTCDRRFLDDMVSACYEKWYLSQDCINWANTYFLGVQFLGQRYYNAGGIVDRISTPMTTA